MTPHTKIRGTAFADLLRGSARAEHMIGAKGNDTIHGNGGHDRLEGWGGNDRLYAMHGGGGLLAGHTGNDHLEARKVGFGQFHMYGGTGNDRIVTHLYNAASGWGPQGFHVFGGAGADHFDFVDTRRTASLLVNRIDDLDLSRDRITVEGQAINLSNLPGHMRVLSYVGQQWLQIGPRIVIALEGARLATPTAQEVHFTTFPTDLSKLPTVAFYNPMNYVPYHLYRDLMPKMTHLADVPVSITGTAGADYLYEAIGKSNRISTGAGNDVIHAGKGHDTVLGGAGNDTIAGGSDRDQIWGDAGNDLIYGGTEADALSGGLGHDRLFGNSGADSLLGGHGNDVLTGGPGADRLDGGAGFDTADYGDATAGVRVDILMPSRNGGDAAGDVLISIEALSGSSHADQLLGNNAVNHLRGQAGHDLLDGRGGNDMLWGGVGNDTLIGGTGNDLLRGEAGADRLIGGAGRDTLDGGFGDRAPDTFVFLSASDSRPGAANRDTVIGFASGQDRIDLRAIDAHSGQAGDQAFSLAAGPRAHGVWTTRSSDGLILSADLNGDARPDFEIFLQGTTRLTATDLWL
ncbi:M10 family metallopeptidase C-terminal domain-containing protein [Paracoccus sp. p3-h83]|uniref:calcium-binding protein n=1 Tax=Paracoccus sp. p3-h83 TaxID=3342805 RepID=UPI0035BB372B